MPEPIDLPPSLAAFSSWTRFQALAMRLAQIDPIAWTPQALEAFAAAESSPGDLPALELASALAVSEWNASGAKARATAELSLFCSMPTPSETPGQWHLISPLTATGLLARGPLEIPLRADDEHGELRYLPAGQEAPVAQWAKTSYGASVTASWQTFPAAQIHEQLAARADARRGQARHSDSVASASIEGTLAMAVDRFEALAQASATRLAGPAAPWIGSVRELLSSFKKQTQALKPGPFARNLDYLYWQARRVTEEWPKSEPLAILFSGRPQSNQSQNFLQTMLQQSSDESPLFEALCHIVETSQWPVLGDDPLSDQTRLLTQEAKASFERIESGPGAYLRGGPNLDFSLVMQDAILAALHPLLNPLPELVNGKPLDRIFHNFIHSMQKAHLRAPSRLGPHRGHDPLDGMREMPKQGWPDRQKAMDVERLFEECKRFHFSYARQLKLNPDGSIPRSAPSTLRAIASQAPHAIEAAFFGPSLALDASQSAALRETHWMKSLGWADSNSPLDPREAFSSHGLAHRQAQLRLQDASMDGSSKILAYFAALKQSPTTIESRHHLARLGMGSIELAEFADSSQGKAYQQCCQAFFAHPQFPRDIDIRRNLSTVLLLAFEAQRAAGEGSPDWAFPLAPERVEFLIAGMAFASPRTDVYSIGAAATRSHGESIYRALTAAPVGDSLEVATNKLPIFVALDYASARTREANRQARSLSLAIVEDLLAEASHAKTLYAEPLEARAAFCPREFLDRLPHVQFGDESLGPLPLAWRGDDLASGWSQLANVLADPALAMVNLEADGFGPALALADKHGLAPAPRAKTKAIAPPALSIADPGVDVLLAGDGLLGSLARLAAKAGHAPDRLDPQAEPRSRANAWIAAGKSAAKAWFGAADATLRLVGSHPASAAQFIALAKSRSEREARAAGKRIAPTDDSPKDREGRRFASIFAQAAAKGLDARAAFAAFLAAKSSPFAAGDVHITRAYAAVAIDPLLSEGVAIQDAIHSLRREVECAAALRPRWHGALVERAASLLAADDAATPKERAAVSRAASPEARAAAALREELSGIEDWGHAMAGRFYANLPAKLSWSTLAAGSRRWHAQAPVAGPDGPSVGRQWEPIGISWASDDGVWSARELASSAALDDEGKAMHHCVGSYASHCHDGDARIVSILKNGQRSSTLELRAPGASMQGQLSAKPHAWKITQNRSHCNRDSEPQAKAAANAILAAAILASRQRFEGISQAAKAAGNAAPAVPLVQAFELPGFDPVAALAKHRAQAAAKSDGKEPQEPPSQRWR